MMTGSVARGAIEVGKIETGVPLPSRLPIAKIRTDGGTQPRATIQRDWIEEYAADMIAGAVFPPVVVFYDGAEYWLADGFHRLAAARGMDRTEIDAPAAAKRSP